LSAPIFPVPFIRGATVLLQYLFAPLSLAAHLPFPEHHHSFHPPYLLFFSAVQGKKQKKQELKKEEKEEIRGSSAFI
jgi:hypothetical protein